MSFDEMWDHKPHTRKPPRNFDNNKSQSGSFNFLSNQDGNHDGYTTFNQSDNNLIIKVVIAIILINVAIIILLIEVAII